MCIKWRKIRSAYFNVSNGVRQGGVISHKLFDYVDDLSQDLDMCKSGCYIDDQCVNHVVCENDICLLTPSAIGLKRIFNVSFYFSIRNDIKFNPIIYVCIVYNPKNIKLYCPSVYVLMTGLQ